MFRTLGSRIYRRKDDLEKKYYQEEEIQKIIHTVMLEVLTGLSQDIKITTTFEKNTLLITAPHKVIAQEIVLKAKQIQKSLKLKNIICNKIIIR